MNDIKKRVDEIEHDLNLLRDEGISFFEPNQTEQDWLIEQAYELVSLCKRLLQENPYGIQ